MTASEPASLSECGRRLYIYGRLGSRVPQGQTTRTRSYNLKLLPCQPESPWHGDAGGRERPDRVGLPPAAEPTARVTVSPQMYNQLYNVRNDSESTCCLCLCSSLPLFGSEQYGT